MYVKTRRVYGAVGLQLCVQYEQGKHTQKTSTTCYTTGTMRDIIHTSVSSDYACTHLRYILFARRARGRRNALRGVVFLNARVRAGIATQGVVSHDRDEGPAAICYVFVAPNRRSPAPGSGYWRCNRCRSQGVDRRGSLKHHSCCQPVSSAIACSATISTQLCKCVTRASSHGHT